MISGNLLIDESSGFFGVLSQISSRIFGNTFGRQENPARQDRPRMQQLNWMQMEAVLLAAL
jgi:hypothetical protein